MKLQLGCQGMRESDPNIPGAWLLSSSVSLLLPVTTTHSEVALVSAVS